MGIFMKTLGERIRDERRKRKWSQAFLAKKVGATQAAISEVERDIPRSSGLVIPIAKAFKMEVSQLVDGKTHILNQMPNEEVVYVPGLNQSNTDNDEEYVMIPRYDVRASCGDGIDVNEVNIIDGMPMPASFLKANGLPDAHLLAVIQASGYSMSPTIEHEQILMVNTVDVEPKSSKIYLVCVDDKLFIKRLVYTPDGWIMRSDNPNKNSYPDFLIAPDKVNTVDIQGRICWQSGLL